MEKVKSKPKRLLTLFLTVALMLTFLPLGQTVHAAASTGTFSFQRTGVTYSHDGSLPAPFGSHPDLKRFYAYHVNQDNSGSLKQAYCIQYGAGVLTGTQLGRGDDYAAFSSTQKDLLAKALTYGYNEASGTKYGGSWEEETVATQMLVWIISHGQYGSGDEYRIVNHFLASNGTARSIYDKIRNNVAAYDTIPSFTGSGPASAPSHELKYNMVNGRFELTLNDANNVLRYFDFSGSGITFTRSGNQLTISTQRELNNATFTAYKQLPRDQYPLLVTGFAEYWTHGTYQDLVSLNTEPNGPQIPAVLKLKTEELGNADIIKTSEDGVVGGFRFHIAGNGWERTVTTDSNGRFLIERLKKGFYTITELDVPNRYVVPQPQVVEVKPGRTTEVQFNNVLKKFHIYITKSDVETGGTPQGDATLSGAVYHIYDAWGNHVDTVVGDGPVAKSKLLVLGSYTVYEVQPPQGYNINMNPVTVHGDFEGQTVEIGRADTGIQDAVVKGQVALVKFADKRLIEGGEDDGGIKTPLAGVEFTLTLESTGQPVCTIVTDADGYAITPLLPYGTYRVEETKGVEGYRNITPFTVKIDTHGKIYKYILENKVFESDIRIVKKDKETGNTIPLAGTTFKVMDSAGNWVAQSYNYPTPTTIDEYETAADGTLVMPQPLPAGDYWLYEIKAPHGYTVSTEPVKFTVSSANQSTVLEVVAENMPVKGTITIEKLGEYLVGFEKTEDETYGPIYTPIYKVRGVPGTVYDVVAVTDIVTPDGTVRAEAGSVVATLTTGKDGRATSPELYLGQYQLIEKSVPVGFVLDENPIPFELTYENQDTAIVVENEWHENNRQKALITLKKNAETTENQTYNPYPDIRFGLYSGIEFMNGKGEVVLEKDALLEIISLDETGVGVIQSDLPFASYYVKELAAGNGYYLNDQAYEFTLTHTDTGVAVVEITIDGAVDEPAAEDTEAPGEGEEAESTEPEPSKGIPNTLMRGAIRVEKSTEGSGVEGFAFRITGTSVNGTPYEAEFETDAEGVILVESLPIGEYTVTEVANDKTVGYILPDSQTVTVKADEETTVAFENRLIRGGVKLIKTDPEGERLNGAVFALYTGDGELLEEFEITENGEHYINDLLYGSYYLLELEAPDGYKLSDHPYPFTIAHHEEIIEITAENELATGGVRLIKTDAANKDAKLQGAVFELFDSEGNKIGDTYTTNKDGVIEVDGLVYGDYYFVEKTAPKGFALDTTKIKFTLTAENTKDGTVLLEVTATNKQLTGSVRLTKTDADKAGTTLKGAVFELYTSGGTKVGDTYTTNDKGFIEVEGLAYGDYYFIEKTAPDGYQLDSKKITFTISADTTKNGTVPVEVTATNKAVPGTSKPPETPKTPGKTPTPDNGKGDSPKTGDAFNIMVPVALLLIGAAGLTTALVMRKKRKPKQK